MVQIGYSSNNSQLSQLTVESGNQGHSWRDIWHWDHFQYQIHWWLLIKYVSTTNGFPGLTIYDFIGTFFDGYMFLQESLYLRLTIEFLDKSSVLSWDWLSHMVTKKPSIVEDVINQKQSWPM